MVKNPPANAGDIRDASSIPGSGNPLEEGMAIHSSILLLLLLLSHFSGVRLCATPWTAATSMNPGDGILQARTLEWVAISFSNA